MLNAVSSMELQHWLIIGGVALVVLGFVGLAFIWPALRQANHPEAEFKELANENEQGRSEFEAEPAQTHKDPK